MLVAPALLVPNSMGVGRIVSRGAIVRGWPKVFFQGVNSGEISFYQLKTNTKTFFY